MVIGKGYRDSFLAEGEVKQLLVQAFEDMNLDNKRIPILIPDRTRTAPFPLFFQLFYENLQDRVAALDYLVTLGTNHPMDEEAINQRVNLGYINPTLVDPDQ